MNARKILGYALGSFGSALFSVLALPLISWYFPADDIGRIVLLQTVAGLGILVLGLGLDQAYIRDFHAVENQASLFKSLALPPLLLCAAVLFFALVFDAAMPSETVFAIESETLGILALVFLAASLASRFLSLILRMQEQALAFSFSQITPKLLILFIVLLYLAAGFPAQTAGLVFAYAAAQVLTVCVLLYQTRRYLIAAWHSPFSAKLRCEGLRYALPLAAGNLAYWGFASIDRFMLKSLAGLEELGIYSMAASFGAAALIVQSVFSTVWAPTVFKWVKENTHLDQIGGITLAMSSLVGGVVCLIGLFSPLAALILPAQYAAVQFILLSSLLFPLLYTLTEVSGIGLNVAKKTGLITLANLLALAANALFLWILVPPLGARGAAIACACAFWLFFAFKTEYSSRLWQPLPRRKIYAQSLACLLVCTSYTAFGTTENYPAFAASWAAWLGVLLHQNRRRIDRAFEQIKCRLKNKAHKHQ